jgi:hypothetical protein
MTRYPTFKFNRKYFLLALILLSVEVIIALYFHDPFIRPYVGDLLVVILVYCCWKSFINTGVIPTALGVLLFAFFVEWLQYINFIQLVGWQHSKLARTVIGYSFEWMDVLAYIAGTGLVLIIENWKWEVGETISAKP